MKTIKTVEEAINAIVDYNTLPSQIDYRVPQKIKSIEAEKYLEENLNQVEFDKVMLKIEQQINKYYEYSFTGEAGIEYSCAELDEMF